MSHINRTTKPLHVFQSNIFHMPPLMVPCLWKKLHLQIAYHAQAFLSLNTKDTLSSEQPKTSKRRRRIFIKVFMKRKKILLNLCPFCSLNYADYHALFHFNTTIFENGFSGGQKRSIGTCFCPRPGTELKQHVTSLVVLNVYRSCICILKACSVVEVFAVFVLFYYVPHREFV